MTSAKGLVLSNELIDAFPLSAVRLNPKTQQIEVLTLAPAIALEIAQDKLGEELCSKRNQFTVNDQTFLNLLPEDFSHFEVATIQWKHTFLPIEAFPDVQAYIEKFGIPYRDHFKSGNLIFLNIQAPKYIQEIKGILEKGFVMTIDYGLTTDRKHNPHLNLFGKGGYQERNNSSSPYNDLFSGMGQFDLTANIDFKVLLDEGLNNELQPLALIRQNNLAQMMPDLSTDTLSFQSSSNDGGFYALVQQKANTQAQYFIPSHSFVESNCINKERLYSRMLYHFFEHSKTSNFEEFKVYFEQISAREFEVSQELAQLFLSIKKLSLEESLELLKENFGESSDYAFGEAVICGYYTLLQQKS